MRFINLLPVIEESLPVCPEGTDISVSYYLFNKWTSQDAPDNVDQLVLSYAHEAVYAYRQLLRHTNIEECGRVRFFMDHRCQDQMFPYFESVGLNSLVEIVDVPGDIRLSGYIPQLSHEAVEPCRYRFHCDADLWWFSNEESAERFDWRGFCDYLDTASEDALFGQPIQKHDWIYQINYSGHAVPEDVQNEAHKTLTEIFGPRIPSEFDAIAHTPNLELRKELELSPFRCFAGWFVGVRKDSASLWYLNKLYFQYEKRLSDDEGLYSLLFYMHPELEQFQAIQGEGDAVEFQVKQASIMNYRELEGVGTVNVGASEFSNAFDKFKDDIEGLARVFVGDDFVVPTEPVKTELPPAPLGLRTFGDHIAGTYALDNSGNEFPLLSHTKNNHSVLFGFPAAFKPIKYPLPPTTVSDPEIAVFFCLFNHPLHASHDMHVYAKSMVYAYKQLLKNTTIQDVGRVFMFVDERAMQVVYPYCVAANIKDQVVPFKSDKNIQYAAYIPQFWHEVMEGIEYRFYMDVDMWWVNLFDKDRHDYVQMVESLRSTEADVFGYLVPKTPETVSADIYLRSTWESDMHIERARSWMTQTFGDETLTEEPIRAISGSHNGMRAGFEMDKLLEFYREVGDFVRDDEAFWTLFLAKHPEIKLHSLSEFVHGTGYHEEELAKHDSAQLAHVGTYMFEHFFNKPYASMFYDHCKEPC